METSWMTMSEFTICYLSQPFPLPLTYPFFNRSEISIDDYNRENDGGDDELDDGGFDFGD